MRVSTLLGAAAKRIEEQGFYNGYGSPPGSQCVVTAVTEVAGNNSQFDMRDQAYRCIAQELGLPLKPDYDISLIIDWNDSQTDPAVVIDTLRFAAKRAAEDER